MKNLNILNSQLEETCKELEPLIDYAIKVFSQGCMGDYEIISKINPLINRKRNILININQLKQKQ